MAGLDMKIAVELRPCLVKGRKHLFHCWNQRAWVVDASPLRGGHPGGQCSLMMAVVEDENGQVHEVYPRDVRFVDGALSQYCFGPNDVPPEKGGGEDE